jgi:hypothetical protein
VPVPAVGVAPGKKFATTPGEKTSKTTKAMTRSPRMTDPPTSKGMRAEAGGATVDRSTDPPGEVYLACSVVPAFVLVARLLLER